MIEPTGYTALDLIGFTDRGGYDPDAYYVKNDIVTVGNTKWRCLIDDTHNITPTEGVNWTIYLESATSLAGMDDVDLNSPTDGDIVVYNGTSQRWENSHDELSAIENVYGAKQLIPYPPRDTSGTKNGVTFTANNDGSYTLNGQYNSSSDSSIGIVSNNSENCKKFIKEFGGKSVIATLECSDATAKTKIYLQSYKLATSDDTIITYTDDEDVFTVNTTEPSSGGGIYLVIVGSANGYTFDNVTVKPMIRDARIKDGTFVPHAMTNRELTEKTSQLQQDIPIVPFITPALTTSTNDANNLPCGFTRLNDNNANMPTHNNVWYDVMTVRQSNDSGEVNWGYGFQLAVQTTSDSNFGDTYIRALNGGATPSWSAWKKLN